MQCAALTVLRMNNLWKMGVGGRETTIDLNFGQTSWRAGNVQGKSKKQKTESRKQKNRRAE